MQILKKLMAAAVAAVAMAAVPAPADQGVSDDEILIGSVSDLSGPFSAFGAPAVASAQMHFDAVNAAGGVHGRMIRFIVEDSSYQMPKAIQAYNKLVNRDGVFAMLLSLGTPMNIAGFELMTPKNIPNLMPLSASRHMLDEPIRLRFSASSSYYEQMRLATRYMVETHGVSRVCGMYIPSDFGKEMQEAAAHEADTIDSLTYVTETTHKVDEIGLRRLAAEAECRRVRTDRYSAQRASDHHGHGHGEEARTFPPEDARHLRLLSHRGGPGAGAVSPRGCTPPAPGLTWRRGTDQEAPAAFIAAYGEAHGEFPGTGALLGHVGATQLTRALEMAGPALTVDNLVAAIESLDYHDPLMDNQVSYSADDHTGADTTILSVIEDGGWKEVARLH